MADPRTALPGQSSNGSKVTPASLAEIKAAHVKPKKGRCRACGSTEIAASMSVRLFAYDGKTQDHVATKSGPLCEPCAVRLWDDVMTAIEEMD